MIPFCNPFDEALASQPGAPAVFLLDREGMLRFDETWTRDAWGRDPGPHAWGVVWRLLRDRATGYVTLVMTTSPTLNATHPRCDVRSFATWEEASAARASWGPLPLCPEPWETP
jgi:hypothetical protein